MRLPALSNRTTSSPTVRKLLPDSSVHLCASRQQSFSKLKDAFFVLEAKQDSALYSVLQLAKQDSASLPDSRQAAPDFALSSYPECGSRDLLPFLPLLSGEYHSGNFSILRITDNGANRHVFCRGKIVIPDISIVSRRIIKVNIISFTNNARFPVKAWLACTKHV